MLRQAQPVPDPEYLEGFRAYQQNTSVMVNPPPSSRYTRSKLAMETVD
jgi:hypothetical protein